MTASHAERGWVPSDDELGARLALIRQKMGWNMKEAALACGLPAATWRLWEMSGARPRDIDDAARRIAEASGADYWWIIGGQRAMMPVPDEGIRRRGSLRRRWGRRRSDKLAPSVVVLLDEWRNRRDTRRAA